MTTDLAIDRAYRLSSLELDGAKPRKSKCCEACVYGGLNHAEWCDHGGPDVVFPRVRGLKIGDTISVRKKVTEIAPSGRSASLGTFPDFDKVTITNEEMLAEYRAKFDKELSTITIRRPQRVTGRMLGVTR